MRPGELDRAKTVAKEIGILHKTIYYDELGEPGFAENPIDRCYHCKKGLIRELKKIAWSMILKLLSKEQIFPILKDHRPGHRAVIEEGVYNPFVEFKSQKRRSGK